LPAGSVWNQRIEEASVDSESDTIINYLYQNHTDARRFQIDFSLTILSATAATEHRPFTPTGDFFTPDCDPVAPPIPAGGAIEGESGYACLGDGDCHLIVIDADECRLFEMWRANITGSGFFGGCQAVWDLTRDYGTSGRGSYCSSADAAGLPIAPLLFTADEVLRGEIKHALRFAIPNTFIRHDVYVAPGTHATRQATGPVEAPPYATRLRLKAETDIDGLNPAARVIATTLKSYGMFLADGGNITFMGASDTMTQAKWPEVELGPHDLKALSWSDFEVVDAGSRITWSDGDCVRTPIAD
jgi:serine/threonine-protein kinase